MGSEMMYQKLFEQLEGMTLMHIEIIESDNIEERRKEYDHVEPTKIKFNCLDSNGDARSVTVSISSGGYSTYWTHYLGLDFEGVEY